MNMLSYAITLKRLPDKFTGQSNKFETKITINSYKNILPKSNEHSYNQRQFELEAMRR